MLIHCTLIHQPFTPRIRALPENARIHAGCLHQRAFTRLYACMHSCRQSGASQYTIHMCTYIHVARAVPGRCHTWRRYISQTHPGALHIVFMHSCRQSGASQMSRTVFMHVNIHNVCVHRLVGARAVPARCHTCRSRTCDATRSTASLPQGFHAVFPAAPASTPAAERVIPGAMACAGAGFRADGRHVTAAVPQECVPQCYQLHRLVGGHVAPVSSGHVTPVSGGHVTPVPGGHVTPVSTRGPGGAGA